MAWILTIDTAGDHAEALTERLWGLGTNGVAELPSTDGHSVRLLAGFETEAEADGARAETGGTIAAVDPSMWPTPDATTVEIAGRTLTIDAGHSFGHGAHPTTRLCLDALQRQVGPGLSVLDVGCGSGVLSLAARLLGADPVVAIDIDPAAIEATAANAAANDMTIDVSTTPVDSLREPFDVVVANMLVAELEPIAAAIRSVASGVIILSGALVAQADRWSVMFDDCSVLETTVDGEWAGRIVQVT